MKTKLYMKVTTDELETPLIVCNSRKELADKCGVTTDAINCAIWYARKRGTRCMYKIVEIEDITDEEVKDLYESGTSVKEICATYGFEESSVRRVLKKMGASKKNKSKYKQVFEENDEYIRNACKSGKYTQWQIAFNIGVPTTTLSNYLYRNGIEHISPYERRKPVKADSEVDVKPTQYAKTEPVEKCVLVRKKHNGKVVEQKINKDITDYLMGVGVGSWGY